MMTTTTTTIASSRNSSGELIFRATAKKGYLYYPNVSIAMPIVETPIFKSLTFSVNGESVTTDLVNIGGIVEMSFNSKGYAKFKINMTTSEDLIKDFRTLYIKLALETPLPPTTRAIGELKCTLLGLGTKIRLQENIKHSHDYGGRLEERSICFVVSRNTKSLVAKGNNAEITKISWTKVDGTNDSNLLWGIEEGVTKTLEGVDGIYIGNNSAIVCLTFINTDYVIEFKEVI